MKSVEILMLYELLNKYILFEGQGTPISRKFLYDTRNHVVRSYNREVKYEHATEKSNSIRRP